MTFTTIVILSILAMSGIGLILLGVFLYDEEPEEDHDTFAMFDREESDYL